MRVVSCASRTALGAWEPWGLRTACTRIAESATIWNRCAACVLSSNLVLYVVPGSHRVMSCYLFSRPVTSYHVTTCVLGPLMQ